MKVDIVRTLPTLVLTLTWEEALDLYGDLWPRFGQLSDTSKTLSNALKHMEFEESKR